MIDFIPGMDPASMMGPSLNVSGMPRTNKEASKAFISLFLSQILKDVLKSQNALFDSTDGASMFSNDLYNQILISKISEDLAKNDIFGFDEMTGFNDSLNSSVIGERDKIL